MQLQVKTEAMFQGTGADLACSSPEGGYFNWSQSRIAKELKNDAKKVQVENTLEVYCLVWKTSTDSTTSTQGYEVCFRKNIFHFEASLVKLNPQ